MNKIIDLDKREIKKVSVVCPYYNEEAILREAVTGMLKSLSSLKYDWELILVNDGSTDKSFEIVKEVTKDKSRAVLVTYHYNQGRGCALEKGIESATGDIIITTEIDLSWGEDIVHRILEKFESKPHIDCIVASPNLSGGGYKNVPFRRVAISKIGNFLIRRFFVPKITKRFIIY